MEAFSCHCKGPSHTIQLHHVGFMLPVPTNFHSKLPSWKAIFPIFLPQVSQVSSYSRTMYFCFFLACSFIYVALNQLLIHICKFQSNIASKFNLRVVIFKNLSMPPDPQISSNKAGAMIFYWCNDFLYMPYPYQENIKAISKHIVSR